MASKKRKAAMRAVAQFCGGNDVELSITVQLRGTTPLIESWIKMRQALGLVGYTTIEEVEAKLVEVFAGAKGGRRI